VQLAAFSLPMQLMIVLVRGKMGDLIMLLLDPSSLCASSWMIAVSITFAGLITSVVLRYADNNLKGLAQLVGIIFTVFVCSQVFGLTFGRNFVLGCTLVIGSTIAFIFSPVPTKGAVTTMICQPTASTGVLDAESTAFLRTLTNLRRRSASAHQSKILRWVWPKELDGAVLLKHLESSIDAGVFTNHGPGAKALELEAKKRLSITKHAVLAVCSGTAALHALLAVHVMRKLPTAGGILVSAFGFPPILQANWKGLVRMTDIDPVYGGPRLPAENEPVPSIICLVNPFGYRVDVKYYRRYCDEHGIPLWMDNASSPLHFLESDGTPLHDLADGVGISLHETKPIGRGEGGLMLVPIEHERIARMSLNFGYDVTQPPDNRVYHVEASNWRMSDFQAAAILMHWELHWNEIVDWMRTHESVPKDCGPFKIGGRGTLYSCIMEPRQRVPDPNVDIKYYYKPLLSREEAPHSWASFESLQCRPFHPGPGEHGSALG